ARNHRLEEMLEDQEQEPGSDSTLLRGCFSVARLPSIPADSLQRLVPYPLPMARGVGLDEVVVTGIRASLAPPEALADYYLYRVPWPTDLNARQTKQAVFLEKPRVRAERFYSLRFDVADDDFDD